ncbi:MAG: low specificity L-threonine aldolase [Beijerinckiaceae bacterium]
MFFASDNGSGASPAVLDALVRANTGFAMPYGADEATKAAEAMLSDLFERECAIFLVPTGTAANALCLASLCPPWGAIFAHSDAHVMDDECGAPEFFTNGAKLVGLAGACGKIGPAALQEAIAAYPAGLVKQVQPAALTLSQATESGTLYTLDEIAGLSDMAHAAGLKVHMDGARFANAVAALGASPAEMTWKAGIDVLSFGGTKNGALMCEAAVFFDPGLARDFLFRRKRSGHTVSKARFLGAQMLAYLEKGHWLELASHANAMAQRLALGLGAVSGVRLPWPADVNEVFAILPPGADAALKKAGAVYYAWSAAALPAADRPGDGETFVRLVTSFATRAEEVDSFLEIVSTHKA